MQNLWVPAATTLGFVGAAWQMVSATMSSIDSMSSFLGAHNRIQKEEQQRIYATVPGWQLLRRRKQVRASRKSANGLLTPEEDRVSRQFDREANGWSLVIVATGILTVVAWVDWFSQLGAA